MNKYDVIIVGSGASGVFASYEFKKLNSNLKVLVIDKGNTIYRRQCPIKTGQVESCIGCKPCNIMNGYGGAGTLSDGKYNITTNFGGQMHDYLGKEESIELMEYVDSVLCRFDGGNSKLYETSASNLKTLALKHDLHLLDAKVRHFGTDRNVKILEKIYEWTKDKVEMIFNTTIVDVEKNEDFKLTTDKGETFYCDKLVLASGRSGSKWISEVCKKFNINLFSNQVDINGIITVNGHSYADPKLQSENTNFALLVSNTFTEPFKDSNEYGESIAKLSNMLGGGVLLQRFGDLVKGRRSDKRRMLKCFTEPTLKATPGDLSLVIPKRQLDSIIEMIYALDKIAPGTANDDTLLYGVEVKFYNSRVETDSNFETSVEGLFVVGDGGGATHSLSQASACGVYVARYLNSIMS